MLHYIVNNKEILFEYLSMIHTRTFMQNTEKIIDNLLGYSFEIFHFGVFLLLLSVIFSELLAQFRREGESKFS